MPFTASLNVAINDVGSFCNIIIMVPYLIRILYGQLTQLEIIADQKHGLHYGLLTKWKIGKSTKIITSALIFTFTF